MSNVVQENQRIEREVRQLADGFAAAVAERTVSEVVCLACGEVKTVRGIVEFLVFESEHRHDE